MKKWQVVVKRDQEGGKRFRYEDCQKNQAADTGGYAVDGCHEFMEAATDALRCAACHCHRNFHRRKEIVAEVNPTHEKPFDNVQIQSYGTTNLEEKGEGDDEFVKENDKQSTSSAPLESRKSRKRTHNDDIEIQNISTQLTKVAMTLQKISECKLDVDLLYQEVMKTEGFEEDFLISAFDHLVEHKTFAKGFLVKNDALRRTWLEKFKEKN